MNSLFKAVITKISNPIARSWAGKGFWAVADQSLFSGANFLVNLLLARWLPPKEYGAFAVTFSLFYFFAGFHTAVLTEPMLVFGAGKYREGFRKYLGMLFYGHWVVSVILVVVLGVAALAMNRLGSSAMAQALGGLAFALPFILLLWLMRRSCYVMQRPFWAVGGSAVNLIVAVAGAFMLWRAELLSILSALALLGVAAGVASAFLTLRLQPQVRGFAGNPTPMMVVLDHWGYARWVMLESVIYSVSAQLWLMLVPLVLGLSASGILAAVWNLYRPVSLFMQALGLTLLPTFAGWVSRGVSAKELQRRALGLAIFFGGSVALYGVLLTLAAQPLLHWLYDGKYDQHWVLVPLMGGSTVAAVVVQSVVIAMKAQKAVPRIPLIWGVSAVTTLLISVPLMILVGISGALLGYALGYALAAWVAFRTLGKVLKDSKGKKSDKGKGNVRAP